MKIFQKILTSLLFFSLISCRSASTTDNYIPHLSSLENILQNYITGKDARIGIVAIINSSDTLNINGDEVFPMLSTYKFPQALAVADFCLKNKIEIRDSIFIDSTQLKSNTWSPMRDKYGQRL